MIIVVNILLIAGMAFWGRDLCRTNDLKQFYWPALLIKLGAGVVVGLLYSQYYESGDSWAMMAEAVKLKNTAFASFNNFIEIFIFSNYDSIQHFSYTIQPRAAFMTKILAPIIFITQNNYWLTSGYLSLFSFFGFWALANIVYQFHGNKWVAVVPTLFFPSIVFWSSGVLKESVALGSLAILFAMISSFYFTGKKPWYKVLFLLIAFLLVLYLKYYYAAVLAVVFLTLFIARYIIPKSTAWYLELGYILALFTLFIAMASLTHPNFWPSRFMMVIVDNYYQYTQKSTAGSMVIFADLQPTIKSLLLNSPKALFFGLFSPLWMPVFSFLRAMAVLENWLLLLAFIYAIKQFSLPAARDMRLLFFAMLIFVVTMAIFITFSSPNYGTLSRYRVGYLMIFIIFIGGSISSRTKSA